MNDKVTYYCPIIKDECVGEKCVWFISEMDTCVARVLMVQVLRFVDGLESGQVITIRKE